jgi:hypothetical protein
MVNDMRTMARLYAEMQSDFWKFYLLLISRRLHLGCPEPILHAIHSTKTRFS